MNSTFTAGMVLSLSLIMAIGPQNAHVMRMGIQRQHLWLTVAVCVLADVALICVGVLGLGRLGGLPEKLHGAMIGAGVLFLSVYGWRAFQRLMRPQASPGLSLEASGAAHGGASRGASAGEQPGVPQWRQAALAALAFSFLNPHAWLDMAVLVGTASLAYGAGSAAFGMGAAAGSLLWFLTLGAGAWLLGRRFASPRVWRVLDGVVALMMWGTAAWLVAGLF